LERFVVGSGRCGSTLLSRMLSCHPDAVSIFEVLNGLDLVRRFAEGPVPGPAFADLVTAPQPFLNAVLRRGYPVEEVVYPFGEGRYGREDAFPYILGGALPRLSDEPDALFDELAAFARARPESGLRDHYRALFGWLARRAGREHWIEKSGSSIDYLEALHAFFPGARFLHLHRDGPEVALSMREHHAYRLPIAVMYRMEIDGVPFDELLPIDLEAAPHADDTISRILRSRPPAEHFGRYWTDQVVRGARALRNLDASTARCASRIWSRVRATCCERSAPSSSSSRRDRGSTGPPRSCAACRRRASRSFRRRSRTGSPRRAARGGSSSGGPSERARRRLSSPSRPGGPMSLKLGLQLGYWGAQPHQGFVESAQEAERLGFDSVWTAEAWGSDAFTPLAWIGAHTRKIKLGTSVVQLSARTPTATAMAALTLDHLSGGRLILGLGVSGPQVVEGWYGRPFSKPLARTREYVDVVRQVLRREAPVSNPGPHYPLPYTGEGAWGMGKPLRSITHPLRADVPIYLGAEGPRNVALATEIADGWLPLYYSPFRPEVYADSLAGARPGFEIAQMVMVSITDDVEAGLVPQKAALAFYIGGMGSKKRNFHKELMGRMGFAAEAEKIQELFMEGKRAEAIAAVPDAFADELSLVGPIERIRDRLDAWRETPVTTLLLGSRDPATLRALAELVL